MITVPLDRPLFISSSTLATDAGVAYRRIDYWIRRGYLRTVDGVGAPGSGMARAFAPREVDVARVLAVVAPLVQRDGPITQEDVQGLSRAVRAGVRGRVRLVAGIVIDVDEILARPG